MAALVGREVELEALERFVAGRAAGLCVLEGEPGIGKTRFLQELARRAAGDGVRLLSARASVAEVNVPFALWGAVLDARLRELGERGIQRLGVDGLDALAGLLPAIGAEPTSAIAHRVHRALRGDGGGVGGAAAIVGVPG